MNSLVALVTDASIGLTLGFSAGYAFSPEQRRLHYRMSAELLSDEDREVLGITEDQLLVSKSLAETARWDATIVTPFFGAAVGGIGTHMIGASSLPENLPVLYASAIVGSLLGQAARHFRIRKEIEDLDVALYIKDRPERIPELLSESVRQRIDARIERMEYDLANGTPGTEAIPDTVEDVVAMIDAGIYSRITTGLWATEKVLHNFQRYRVACEIEQSVEDAPAGTVVQVYGKPLSPDVHVCAIQGSTLMQYTLAWPRETFLNAIAQEQAEIPDVTLRDSSVGHWDGDYRRIVDIIQTQKIPVVLFHASDMSFPVNRDAIISTVYLMTAKEYNGLYLRRN